MLFYSICHFYHFYSIVWCEFLTFYQVITDGKISNRYTCRSILHVPRRNQNVNHHSFSFPSKMNLSLISVRYDKWAENIKGWVIFCFNSIESFVIVWRIFFSWFTKTQQKTNQTNWLRSVRIPPYWKSSNPLESLTGLDTRKPSKKDLVWRGSTSPILLQQNRHGWAKSVSFNLFYFSAPVKRVLSDNRDT